MNRKAYKVVFSTSWLVGGWLVKLRCPKCGYVWDYKGRKQYYATCPNCFRKVNIARYRVE
jgi:predicted RNA-binding Zn-ribbon protein involved in translation (DUF1610 family)